MRTPRPFPRCLHAVPLVLRADPRVDMFSSPIRWSECALLPSALAWFACDTISTLGGTECQSDSRSYLHLCNTSTLCCSLASVQIRAHGDALCPVPHGTMSGACCCTGSSKYGGMVGTGRTPSGMHASERSKMLIERNVRYRPVGFPNKAVRTVLEILDTEHVPVCHWVHTWPSGRWG